MVRIHVGIAGDHRYVLPAAELHELPQIAALRIEPGRPGVTAIVRRDVDQPGPPASGAPGGLELAAREPLLVGIGVPIRAAEDAALAMIEVAQRHDHALAEGDAAIGPVLRVE